MKENFVYGLAVDVLELSAVRKTQPFDINKDFFKKLCPFLTINTCFQSISLGGSPDDGAGAGGAGPDPGKQAGAPAHGLHPAAEMGRHRGVPPQ